jgi:hypothetical protein
LSQSLNPECWKQEQCAAPTDHLGENGHGFLD